MIAPVVGMCTQILSWLQYHTIIIIVIFSIIILYYFDIFFIL